MNTNNNKNDNFSFSIILLLIALSLSIASCLPPPESFDPVCGNNIIESGEECDEGILNGVVCTPLPGEKCSYCSNECKLYNITGILVPSCTDGKMNGDETDTDCGGSCEGCEIGKLCILDSDCKSEICKNNLCSGLLPSSTPTESTINGPLPNGLKADDIRVLDSTMHSISIEWDIQGDLNHNAVSRVRFRKKGTSVWNEFMPLLRINFTYLPELTNYGRPSQDQFNMFAGSIMFLTPGIEYELWFEVTDPDGGSATRIRTISTKPFPQRSQTCSSTVNSMTMLSSAYSNAKPGDVICLQSGNYGNFRADRGGSNHNYIALVNAPGATPRFDRIRVEASYLWIEGMTFETPEGSSGGVGASSSSIKEFVVVKNNTFKGSKFSIHMDGASRYWYVVDNYIEGDNPPLGTIVGEGVEFSRGSSGHTVAFNTITKVADGNSYGRRNVDVFGNYIFETTDDGIEPDFGYSNKRYWGNRIIDSYYYALSFQPMYSGPWYFIRNEVRQTAWTRQGRSTTSQGGTIFKFNGIVDRFVLLHNTFVHESHSPIAQHKMKHILSTYSRNNIYAVPGSPVWISSEWSANTAIPSSSFYQNDWRTDVDYDGFIWEGTTGFTWEGQNYHTVASFANAVGIQENAVRLNRNDFVNYPTDLRLKQGTSGVNRGGRVLGVNDNHLGSAPDIGAYEYGKEMPHYGVGTRETLRDRHKYWEYW